MTIGPISISLTGLLAFVAFLPWAILAVGFLLSKERWPSLRQAGTSAAIRETAAVRDMGLTYTGLVFAGVALAAGSASSQRSIPEQLLVIALAGAAIAWAISNLGATAWVGDVAEAGLFLSVACILLAMAEILWGADAWVNVAVALAIGVAYGVVLGVSIFQARTHWNETRPADGSADSTRQATTEAIALATQVALTPPVEDVTG